MDSIFTSQKSSRRGWCLLAAILAAALFATVALPVQVLAQSDGGEFDGAVWKFTIRSKVKGGGAMTGNFRVAEHIIYQQANAQDTKFSKKVGSNHPVQRFKTRVEFTDLTATTRKGETKTGLQGSAYIQMDRKGRWSGDFADSAGTRWGFHCTRIQE